MAKSFLLPKLSIMQLQLPSINSQLYISRLIWDFRCATETITARRTMRVISWRHNSLHIRFAGLVIPVDA